MKVKNTLDMVDKVSAISNFVDFAIILRKNNCWSKSNIIHAFIRFRSQHPFGCKIVCKYYDYDMFCDRDDLYNLVDTLISNIEIDKVDQGYVNEEISRFVLSDHYDYPYHEVIK